MVRFFSFKWKAAAAVLLSLSGCGGEVASVPPVEEEPDCVMPSFEVIAKGDFQKGGTIGATRLGELLLGIGVVPEGRILILRASCPECVKVLWRHIHEKDLPDLIVLLPSGDASTEGKENEGFLAALSALKATPVQIVELPARPQGYVASVPMAIRVEAGIIEAAEGAGH